MKTVKIQYLRDALELYGGGLRRATPYSAGLDLRACLDTPSIVIAAGQRAPIGTGIAIEPPQPEDGMGIAGFVYSRSGLGAVKGLTVAQGVGVIDPDYRGEIIVYLLNTSDKELVVERGDRVAQLVFQPYYGLDAETVEVLGESQRGEGGFGHTGSK